MNKISIILTSLIVTFQLCVGKVLLTDPEITFLHDAAYLSSSQEVTLSLNLPLIGELELVRTVDSRLGNVMFESKKLINLNLSPIPLQLNNIRIVQYQGNLEFQAQVILFDKVANVSLTHVKRVNDVKIIESSKGTKLFLDISEMTLSLTGNKLSIKLFNGVFLNFNTASLILRKNKSPKFLVKSTIFDQRVNFDFSFLPEGLTLIKYVMIGDMLLSRFLLGTEFNPDDIRLKNISFTNRYATENLFSKSSKVTIHGNAFADLNIIDKNLPINLHDLPALISFVNDTYEVLITLPEFDVPLLGSINKSYIKVGHSLKLVGNGILRLPHIGSNSYQLEAVYDRNSFLLRGNFNNSIKYDNVLIESPGFIVNESFDSLTIVGKSMIHDIKCLIELTFSHLSSPGTNLPELKIRSMQKSWKPFSDSDDEILASLVVNSPKLFVSTDAQDITVKGTLTLLNQEFETSVHFLKSAKGIKPIMRLHPGSCWKLSDSFANVVEQVDNLIFEDPTFVLTETAFFDPQAHIYFKKGINFVGKLLLDEHVPLVHHLSPIGDVLVSGSIRSDFKNFIWQAPLASGLAVNSKIITIGPMSLALNAQAPLSIISTISVSPTPDVLLDFTGNFKQDGNKLVFNGATSQKWHNICSISGLNMINPTLRVTLDNDYFALASLPEDIKLEGEIMFGNNKMLASSVMSADFNELSLTGHADHFWLNELADNAIEHKKQYSILPPLEMKNIKFHIDLKSGFHLQGTLGIFGNDIIADGHIKQNGLIIQGTMPQLIAPGIEILGTNCQVGPYLKLEVHGDKSSSMLEGTLRLGSLVEIHEPIRITPQGCSFESHTFIAKQKFGVSVIGKSLGFKMVPQFDLMITLKADALNYFKQLIAREVEHYDIMLEKQVKTLLHDMQLLKNNRAFLDDVEHDRLAGWALKESEEKVDNWLKQGLITQDAQGRYHYNNLSQKINLESLVFKGPAYMIEGSTLPLTYAFLITGARKELQYPTDFSNLEKTIKEVAQEVIWFTKTMVS